MQGVEVVHRKIPLLFFWLQTFIAKFAANSIEYNRYFIVADCCQEEFDGLFITGEEHILSIIKINETAKIIHLCFRDI